jgi:hypothetical protein
MIRGNLAALPDDYCLGPDFLNRRLNAGRLEISVRPEI